MTACMIFVYSENDAVSGVLCDVWTGMYMCVNFDMHAGWMAEESQCWLLTAVVLFMMTDRASTQSVMTSFFLT